MYRRLIPLAAIALLLPGCGGTPVGTVQVLSAAADGRPPIAEPLLAGDFDSVLTRRVDDGFLVTAYRQIPGDAARFGRYANFRADAPFITAELTMRFTSSGQPAGQPSLLLRQGAHILTQGPMDGSLKIMPEEGQLNIVGEHQRWRPVGGDGAGADDVTFTIQVGNFLETP